MRLHFRLTEYLQEHGVTQKYICEHTDLREGTLSQMKKSDKVNLRVLETVMDFMEEDDISKLIEVQKEDS